MEGFGESTSVDDRSFARQPDVWCSSDSGEDEIFSTNESSIQLHDHNEIVSRSRISSTADTDTRINREIMFFRIRYLFCPPQPFSGICRFRNFPSGKGVYLLLLLSSLERMAYYQILFWVLSTYLQSQNQNLSLANQALIQALVYNVFACFLYPVAGILADAKIGRYTAVHGSLWILLVGYMGVALLSAFGVADDDPLEAGHYKFLLPLLLVLLCIGTAGFQANIIPYGADQIAYGSSTQVSSYFYLYYWSRNLSLLFTNYVTCSNLPDYLASTLLPVCISTLCIVAALSLLHVFRNWLQIYQEKTNPWSKITKVLYNVATAHRPSQRSAFSYAGREPPSRFDLAKQVHGGRFSNEDVENVKSFLRLLPVLLAIGGTLLAISGVTSIMSVQSRHMAHSYANFHFNTSFGTCSISNSTFWIVNSMSILIVLPTLNLLVYPCLREYTPSLLKRIGLSYVLSAVSSLVLLLIVHVGHKDPRLRILHQLSEYCLFADRGIERDDRLLLSSWTLLLPLLLASISEIFVNVSSLEFFYAQSPHNMRGMMIGLFFFTQGLFSSFAALLLFVFSDSRRVSHLSVRNSGESCAFWYYLILFLITITAFILYIVVSWRYRKRERGDLEERERFYCQLSK